MVSRSVQQLNVVAYDEILSGVSIEPVETVAMPEVSVGAGGALLQTA
jgi:hypothetical protein